MSEKKTLTKITERLKKYEEYEQRCTVFYNDLLIKSDKECSSEIKEVINYIRTKKYKDDQGVLALLYNAFFINNDETPPAKRKTLEGITKRYNQYYKVLKNKPEQKGCRFVKENYITRESLFILAKLNKKGDERFSDVYNSSQFFKDYGKNIRYCPPWKKWLIWDDVRWKRDDADRIYQLAVLR